MNKIDTLLLLISLVIGSSICMSRLTSAWNEFKKEPYFSQVLSAPDGAFFKGKEIWNDKHNKYAFI